MGQIGSIKLQTQSEGTVEIPVFETGDVDLSVWKVQTESGTGAVNLVDPADAEIDQLKLETSQGVKAVSTSIVGKLSVSADFSLNNQNIELTVFEDVDDDGTAEYTETVKLTEGTTTYDLSEIQGLQNSTYWIQTCFENSDIEKTAEISQISLSLKSSSVIDNFERGNLTPYSGDTSRFDIVSSSDGEVYEGENALQATSNGGSYVITAGNDLEILPRQGNTFEIWYYAGSQGEPQQAFLWGVQDANNWYGLEINNDSPDDVLYLRKDGSVLESTGSGDSTPREEWQRIKIIWESDGTITAELHNSSGSPQHTVSHQDDEYTEGEIGFRAGASSGGSKSWWDNYKIID